MKPQWQDNQDTYGTISRTLHWLMAVLFAWHSFGMAVKVIVGKSPSTAFLVGTHQPLGLLLLALVVLRIVWAVYNARRRPPYSADTTGTLARLGHGLIYLLMLLIPSLGLLRQMGSGKAFSAFGIRISETGVEISWMTAPADLMHGLLGWTLLVLILGHVGMALMHHYRYRDGTIRRMAGKRSRARPARGNRPPIAPSSSSRTGPPCRPAPYALFCSCRSGGDAGRALPGPCWSASGRRSARCRPARP